jgi:hypothetical protein
MNRARISSLLLSLCLLLLPSVGAPEAFAADAVRMEGRLSVIWGDPDAGQDGLSRYRFSLEDESGNSVRLSMGPAMAGSEADLASLNGRWVTVSGVAADAPNAGEPAGLQISSFASLPEDSLESPLAVSGAWPWVSIMCKFSDVPAEPKNLAFFQGMYSSSQPGLDHYWREASYDLANVSGSVAVGWFTLPNPKSYYVYGGNLDHERAANDCIGMADPTINFTLYKGINMMFNDTLDCCAWGGGATLTLDGQTRFWSLTWEPPWAYQNISVIEHEMGHGFGMPHSSGMYGETYDNAWDLMSSDGGRHTGGCPFVDPTYGCMGQHPIAGYKDAYLDWIAPGKRIDVNSGGSQTITLERQAQPATTNYQLAVIPIGAGGSYYTVESRRRVGYDQALPADGVVIHRVDSGYAYVVDEDLDGDTRNAHYVAGETFNDATNKISVEVTGATASGHTVIIRNNVPTISLPVALDTDRTVTTGGYAEWFGQSSTSHDGVDAATTGYLPGDNQSSWMTVAVTGPATVSFWWKVSSEASYDYLSFYVGAALYDRISGEQGWTPVTLALPSGTHTLKWEYAKDSICCTDGQDRGWVDQLVVTTLGDAIDTGLPVTTGGNANWEVDAPAAARDGIDCARSGVVGDAGSSWMQVTVNGPATLGFWWKVSSEAGADFLDFYVDSSTPSNWISGDTGWEYRSIYLAAGSHTLRWQYNKNGSGSAGLDCGWVDQLSITSVPGDLDHDGIADQAVYYPANGTWYIKGSAGANVTRNWGWAATIPVPADYDNDGDVDVAVYYPTDGTWYIKGSAGTNMIRNWGWAATIPVPADYDYDGRVDIAVYYPANGTWYIKGSTAGSITRNWGWAATTPAPGDYDGDGKVDLAVYYQVNGTWYIKGSAGTNLTRNWGWSAAMPVPARWDGDGMADVAVYYPTNGTWYIKGSAGVNRTQNWGWNAAWPVPADWDNDGVVDVGVYYATNGTWYIKGSSAGNVTRNWGWNGADPVFLQYQINKLTGFIR